MNIVHTSWQNRYAVYLITALLFAAGLWSAFQLPSNIYPEVNFPRIMILVHSGDLPPDTMLLSVTRPLEEAAMTVQGECSVEVRSNISSAALLCSSHLRRLRQSSSVIFQCLYGSPSRLLKR